MDKYFQQVFSKEESMDLTLEKAREKASFLCESIESQYPFFKGRYLTKKDSADLLSISLSDGFLGAAGFTPESFLLHQKTKGAHQFSPDDSVITKVFAKSFLNCFMGNYKQTKEEYDYIIDKDGTKHKIIVQNIMVLDPAPEGIYLNNYFILKKVFSKNDLYLEDEMMSTKHKKFAESMMLEEFNNISIKNTGKTKIDSHDAST